MKTLWRIVAILLLTNLGVTPTWANSDGAKKEEAVPGAHYYNLYPPFVVNVFGGGRLRFLKADITLRFEDSASEEKLRYHMPAIRHELIMLLSSQNEDALTDLTKKEALRQEALHAVQKVMEEKEGNHGIADLLFMNFVVQR